MLFGAARRAAARNPDHPDALLERAQAAAEQALAELQAVAKSILPAVLEDRGLEGALQGGGTPGSSPAPPPCEVLRVPPAGLVVAHAVFRLGGPIAQLDVR